jgi:hypothetical protein
MQGIPREDPPSLEKHSQEGEIHEPHDWETGNMSLSEPVEGEI